MIKSLLSYQNTPLLLLHNPLAGYNVTSMFAVTPLIQITLGSFYWMSTAAMVLLAMTTCQSYVIVHGPTQMYIL